MRSCSAAVPLALLPASGPDGSRASELSALTAGRPAACEIYLEVRTLSCALGGSWNYVIPTNTIFFDPFFDLVDNFASTYT